MFWLVAGWDPLTFLFMIPTLFVGAVSALYGFGYYHGSRPILHWTAFAGLIFSMVAVLLARHALFFLIAWEVMSLTSLWLIIEDSEDSEVIQAGWTYLVASHVALAALVALFVILDLFKGGEPLLFPESPLALPAAVGGAVFLLGVLGFGTKCGLVPLHVWLPQAHPAAPSHVSAVMSGIMVKMGLYGLLRVLTWCQVWENWWGYLLIFLGLLSATGGVIQACLQKDIKRLLAWSSVENMGLLSLGVGVAILAHNAKLGGVAALATLAVFVHVLNHALFKPLLFLCAGNVVKGCGTREGERLGGVGRHLPFTAGSALAGVIAACSLPPMNGFFSKILLYLAMIVGAISAAPNLSALFLTSATILACVGALTILAFSRFFGIVFLGEPRQEIACGKVEDDRRLRWVPIFLAGVCILFPLSLPTLLQAMSPLLTVILREPVDSVLIERLREVFSSILLVEGIFVVIALLAWGVLRWLRARRTVSTTVTWDCGYAQPQSRMQYSGQSLVRPTMLLTSLFYLRKLDATAIRGLFPAAAAWREDVGEFFGERFYPVLMFVLTRISVIVRRLQGGRVQVYILYVLVALIAVLWLGLE